MNIDTGFKSQHCTRLFKQAAWISGLAALNLACVAQAASTESGQAWPTKPVRVVVPFGGGGVGDVLMRPLADKLSKYNGHTFVIDNRPGAGGNIGAGIAARANADGYSLLFAPGSVLTMNPSLYTQMPFDAESFAPVSLLADMAVLLVVHPKNPAKNVGELISAAKRDPGKLLFASPGAGSSLHLAIELFQRTAGVSLQHIAYKSGGEPVTSVLSGQTTGIFVNPPVVMSQIKAGTLRALAVAGATRLPQLPDVPTTAESGLAGFDVSSWFGMVAPAKTPRAIVTQLNTQIAKALREPDLQQRLVEFGVRPIGGTPEEFDTFLRKDRAKWEGVIRAANIRLD